MNTCSHVRKYPRIFRQLHFVRLWCNHSLSGTNCAIRAGIGPQRHCASTGWLAPYSNIALLFYILICYKVHFDVKRIDIAQVPTGAQEASHWLTSLWREKDQFLKEYYAKSKDERKFLPKENGFVWEVRKLHLNYRKARLVTERAAGTSLGQVGMHLGSLASHMWPTERALHNNSDPEQRSNALRMQLTISRFDKDCILSHLSDAIPSSTEAKETEIML